MKEGHCKFNYKNTRISVFDIASTFGILILQHLQDSKRIVYTVI